MAGKGILENIGAGVSGLWNAFIGGPGGGAQQQANLEFTEHKLKQQIQQEQMAQMQQARQSQMQKDLFEILENLDPNNREAFTAVTDKFFESHPDAIKMAMGFGGKPRMTPYQKESVDLSKRQEDRLWKGVEAEEKESQRLVSDYAKAKEYATRTEKYEQEIPKIENVNRAREQLFEMGLDVGGVPVAQAGALPIPPKPEPPLFESEAAIKPYFQGLSKGMGRTTPSFSETETQFKNDISLLAKMPEGPGRQKVAFNLASKYPDRFPQGVNPADIIPPPSDKYNTEWRKQTDPKTGVAEDVLWKTDKTGNAIRVMGIPLPKETEYLGGTETVYDETGKGTVYAYKKTPKGIVPETIQSGAYRPLSSEDRAELEMQQNYLKEKLGTSGTAPTVATPKVEETPSLPEIPQMDLSAQRQRAMQYIATLNDKQKAKYGALSPEDKAEFESRLAEIINNPKALRQLIKELEK